MKKTTALQELKTKDKNTLFQELRESQNKLIKLRFDASFGKLKNLHDITNERLKIARIWTILAEKSLEEEKDRSK